MVLVIDTETTGLDGYPHDRVLEIGICEYCETSGDISPVYEEVIRYNDIAEFDRDYVCLDRYGREQRHCWIFKNSDLRIEDVQNAGKDIGTVVGEVREIVKGQEVTAYNVPFDLGRFLYHSPWNLGEVCYNRFDIMKLATDRVMELARSDRLEDKALQQRLLNDDSDMPGKYVRAIDSYRALCPSDPAGLNGKQSHRALDDAVQESWILSML